MLLGLLDNWLMSNRQDVCQYLENQALMEEAALEHEGQEELFHYCYHGDRKCVSVSKSLVATW